ncbi:MAG: ATPase [Lachnospiraceae bacterium]|nr:ATPase [Lachnospiraceae bacterium]
MTSRLEQIIAEIEEYIENCKEQPLAKGKIIVDRDEISELLEELKMKTPEEIKRYQKIVANKDAILADAQQRADEIVAEAQVQTNELVSEHQIMQQAYAQANEVVSIATNQAQEILDKATEDANSIRSASIEYTDNLLSNLENIMSNAISTTKERYDGVLSSLQDCYDIVKANRGELAPPPVAQDMSAAAMSAQNDNLDELNLI